MLHVKHSWLIASFTVLSLLVFVGAGCGVSENEPAEENVDELTVVEFDQETEVGADALSDPSDVDVDASVIEVTIDRTAFSPSELTVKKGDTVTWTNTDFIGHTVTSRDLDDDHEDADDDHGHGADPVLDSVLLANGETFSYTFNEVGEFPYHCHPHPNKMGTITVVE